jgi:hypothetical protein
MKKQNISDRLKKKEEKERYGCRKPWLEFGD